MTGEPSPQMLISNITKHYLHKDIWEVNRNYDQEQTWQPPRMASMTRYFICSLLMLTSFSHSLAKTTCHRLKGHMNVTIMTLDLQYK